jgi:hypothetical protein
MAKRTELNPTLQDCFESLAGRPRRFVRKHLPEMVSIAVRARLVSDRRDKFEHLYFHRLKRRCR